MSRKGVALVAALLLALGFAAPNALFADTSITAAGSTALLPLVKASAEQYQKANPSIQISVSGGGSNVGLTNVAQKAVDIGDSDILPPKPMPGLVDHRVCVVAFAVIASPNTGVTGLNKKQLQDIFSARVTNWKQVGGKDQRITVINRPRSSGTRAVFVKVIMGTNPIADSGLVEDASGTVVSTVKTTPGAISYVATGYTRGQGVAELKVDGTPPTDANVISGKYPIWSYEHMFTNGPATKDVARFLTFVETRSVLVHKLGYLLIRDMKVSENDR